MGAGGEGALRNTQYALPNFLKGGSTEVEMRLLDVIPTEDIQGKTTVEIADRVHAMMAADLGPELVAECEENT